MNPSLRLASLTLAFGLLSVPVWAAPPAPATPAAAKPAKNPVVVIKTNMGTMKAEIFADKTPISAQNFLKYVDEKFYDGTIFHRVVPNFVDQAGGYDEKMTKKPTHEPIKNEAQADLPNNAFTLSMARTPDPNSATSQFYINVKDNTQLNYRGPGPNEIGYCVFGKLTEGMDVAMKINQVERGSQGGMGDVPVKAVVIESVRRAK